MKLRKKGFTLIELLVVISIIALLSSVVLSSLNSARDKAKVASARAELNQVNIALNLLNGDTNRMPGGYGNSGSCAGPSSGTNSILLNDSSSGLISTNGSFSNWQGPYIKDVTDPWGNPYMYDSIYVCNGANSCGGNAGNIRALMSGGPNLSGRDVYDSDNIVLVLCKI